MCPFDSTITSVRICLPLFSPAFFAVSYLYRCNSGQVRVELSGPQGYLTTRLNHTAV